MTHGTIEETFEYRMTESMKRFCKEWDFHPKNAEELFDFLESHSQKFAQTIVEDMIQWDDEDNWFKKVAE